MAPLPCRHSHFLPPQCISHVKSPRGGGGGGRRDRWYTHNFFAIRNIKKSPCQITDSIIILISTNFEKIIFKIVDARPCAKNTYKIQYGGQLLRDTMKNWFFFMGVIKLMFANNVTQKLSVYQQNCRFLIFEWCPPLKGETERRDVTLQLVHSLFILLAITWGLKTNILMHITRSTTMRKLQK